jgi:hypothetical protein
LYAPSELLKQVEKQARAEFGNQITYFESWHEEEYTTIIVEIRETALQIPVGDSIRQLINSIIGDEYIVALLVRPVESVGTTDGLFNFTYDGGLERFFINYYAPERPRSNPFVLSIYYYKMIEVIPMINLDAAEDFWRGLIRPVDETYATQQGVNSFCKELAPKLRDFLLNHLDFITHIAEAKGKQLQILAPQSIPLHQPSNGTEPNRTPRQKHRAREERKGARQKQVRRQPALAA